jgi:hypothetical protein
MKYTRILLSLVICGFLTTLASAQSPKTDVVLSDYGKLPLSFEANGGQTDAQVKFLSRGKGYSLFLTGNEAVIALKKPASHSPKRKGLSGRGLVEPQKQSAGEGTVLRMQLAGANAAPQVIGAEELPGKVNYFKGNDPKKWRTNVPTYAKVKYEGVYPGVDLIYYGNQGRLEYDFVVAAGANPSAIQLKFDTGRKLHIDNEGGLVLGGEGSEVRFEKPVVYQEHGAERIPVEGSYVVASGDQIRFRLGDYDHSLPLVVDPVLSYSTYLGGSASDSASGIAVDASGNAYVTGTTSSINFPTANSLQATYGGGNEDAFVAMLNPSGSALVYSSYLGGSGGDFGYAIAVDTAGNAYVTGYTYSTNFPTVNPMQAALHAPNGNAFVSKLNSSGSALIYSTYLGGSGFGDYGNGIAVDASGNAYVAGVTRSYDFPTVNPIQATNHATPDRGSYNAFISELNSSGSALVYSTYLGGSIGDSASAIAVDASGSAYVTGSTSSSDFPTVNPIQPTLHLAGARNAFVSKLNSSGSALVYSTYLGGSSIYDGASAIAVDTTGNAYITGTTGSPDFPITAHPLQPVFGLGIDAFVAKLNPSGSALVYSTYLGTGGRSTNDAGAGIAVDGSGNAYVTGATSSFLPTGNFPTVNPLQTYGGAGDAFVSIINPTGLALVFSTFLGGSSTDTGAGIAVDGSGNAYVTGSTQSTNFPTANALQPTFGGGNTDAFVAKISFGSATTTSLASSANPSFGQSVTFTATVTSNAAGTPTGTVTFYDLSDVHFYTRVLGSAPLNGSAQATLTTSSLSGGTHSISAVYYGDANFAWSTSAPLSEDVLGLQSITVSPNPASVTVGDTLQFTATGHYADGSTANLNKAVIWSSSNTSLATISNDYVSKGLATGVAASKKTAVTITATQGSITGTAQLTVTHY